MEQPPALSHFVGIDVSKDRLDVHVLPSRQTLAVARNGEGLDQLASDLHDLAPELWDPVPTDPTATRLWLRTERQTLRRLPDSGASVFTIRVQMAPLSALAARPALQS